MFLSRHTEERVINFRISGTDFKLNVGRWRTPEGNLRKIVTGCQYLSVAVPQVVTGGQYDVDVTLEAPNKEIIYRQTKTQFDSYNFVPKMTGVYVVCFSNEFSTFSHKLVYMDFQVGDEQPLPGLGEHVTVMTQVRKCLWNIF
jgi:hypothetical protein